MEHARVSISGLGLVRDCHGSLQAQESLPPEEPTLDSMEGDAAHWVVSESLINKHEPEDYLGKLAPNGLMVDGDMVNAANTYVSHVRSLLVGDAHLYVEHLVSGRHLHLTECWGTTDVGIVYPSQRKIRVVDFKYGHGYVDEYMNDQGFGYCNGMGEMIEDSIPGEDYRNWQFEFTIVQPRCYSAKPIRSWAFDGNYLAWQVSQLRDAIERALMPNPTFTSGAHCVNRHCRKLPTCSVGLATVTSVVEFAKSMDATSAADADIGSLLMLAEDAYKFLEGTVKSLSAEVESTLKSGNAVRGWSYEPKTGNLAWDGDENTIKAAGMLSGIDVQKHTLMTPTQAISAGVPETFVNKHASRPNKGVKLKRIKQSDIARNFGEING